MSFLNPAFLFGLMAASIPILIHLFTRRRPREVRFPSLAFLTEVNQSEIRRLKLKQWLLLLLRTLAVACIALAMSRPALEGSVGSRSGASTTVVALVDRSGSMGAATRGGTLLVEARRVLEDLLSTLGPADELLLVPYDAAPAPPWPRPIADLARLRAAVHSLEPGARATDHGAALAVAARALAESRTLNRELFWISDFQEAGFAGASRAPQGPWDQTRAYLVPLTPASRANAGLTDAALTPAETGAALSVTASAYGAAAGDLAVEVRALPGGAALGRGFLPMPERGEASTLLPLARLPEQGGEVLLPDDALELDNRRVFAAGRAGTVRVLLREDGPSALRMALEAGAPASGLAVEAVDAAGLPGRLDDADVIVVNDVERLGSTELQALLDWHRGGGGVMVVLGPRADAGFWNASVLGQLGLGRLGEVEAAPAGAAWRLRRAVAAHPVLAGFEARAGEPLSAARFPAVRKLTPAAGARVLLEFDRAHPALIEAPHTLGFAVSLAADASDFAVSGAFLPLLHQAVKVLARGTAAPSLKPGDRYVAPATTGTWRIEDEQGHEVSSELAAEQGATRLRSAPLERPGLYRVLQAGVVRATFAVNPDPRESDLAARDTPRLLAMFPAGRARVLAPGADLARRVREARYGRELWAWFVVLAILLLVAETILAKQGMTAAAQAPATKDRKAS